MANTKLEIVNNLNSIETLKFEFIQISFEKKVKSSKPWIFND